MKKTILPLRVFSAVLALLLALTAACAAESPAEQTVSLKQYTNCDTVDSLFRAAERALKDGADPKLVYDEMYSIAEERDMLPYFLYALENTAAYGTARTEKLTDLVGGRELSLTWKSPRAAVNRIGFDAYGHYSGSEAFMEMIADPGAQYCMPAGVWTESDFRKAYGTDFSKFKASRPRAGYVCVVIQNGSQSAPETSWNSDPDSFMYVMKNNISPVMSGFFDQQADMPLLTGNPDTASQFWLFKFSYPFRGWYGTRSNRKEVRGFNCEISLTVIDAATHRNVAKCSVMNRLPNTIYSWHNGIAEADTPALEDSKGYSSFVTRVAKAVAKQDENEEPVRRMTPVSAESVLNALLLKQAESSTDPWIQAVYSAGVRNVKVSADSVTFSLRSFDPRVKELGAFAKAADGRAWLRSALENASRYDLELTLPLEGGVLTKKAESTLAAAVKKAAAAAKQGFGGKDMAAALSMRFFPVPVEGKVTDASVLLTPSAAFTDWYDAAGLAETGLSPEDLSIVCYAQKSQTLNAKAGPHRLELTCSGTEPALLTRDCVPAVLDRLAFAPASSRPPLDRPETAVREVLADAALKSHTKPAGKFTFSLDVDELAEGKNPAGYLELLSGFSLSGTVDKVRSTAEMLPDEAASPMPKAGRITGPASGTKVHFDLRADADPVYVELRSLEQNEVTASAFVYPGKRVTVAVPAGYYRIAFCTGPYWFGTETLFSEAGTYYVSESTQVLGTKYTHVYTLDPEDENDIRFTKVSPAEFR